MNTLIKRTLAGIVVVIAANALYLQAQNSLNSYLPDNNEISGWIRDGEAAVATDLSTLTKLINGAAPQYIELGVQEVIFQDYTLREEHYLTIEVYRTNSSMKAQRLYESIYLDEPVIITGLGDAGRFAENLPGAYVLEFQKDSLFIRITTLSKIEETKEAIHSFAQVASGRMR